MSLSKCRHLYEVCDYVFSSVMLVSVDVSASVRMCLHIPLCLDLWDVCRAVMACVNVQPSVCLCVYPGKVTSLLCLLPVSLETDCMRVSL